MKNLLNMAGRLTLVESVLSSMSLHVMSVLPIPKGILKKMDNFTSNFLWGKGSKNMYHWVKFDTICKPKCAGGLGIRSLKDNIKTFQGKLAWNFLKHESLWAKFANSRFIVGKYGSTIWNSVSRRVLMLQNQSYWELGDGNTEVNKYCWHFGIPCRSDIKGLPIRTVLERNSIRNSFLDGVPENIQQYYRSAIYSPNPIRLPWTKSSSGVFSSKAYYNHMAATIQKVSWGPVIW